METCIDYCEPDWAFMSSDERRWINRLEGLHKERPDECIIIRHPAENNGVIYAKFPIKWVRVKPPKQVYLTDEEKAKRAEILRQSRQTDTIENKGEDDEEELDE